MFGNNDDAHRTARDLAAAGVEVAALIDARADVDVAGDFPVYTGGAGDRQRAVGMGCTEITVRHDGGDHHIATDCLAVSGGWNPAVHLTCHMNGRPVWQDDIAAFVPVDGAVPGLVACGAAKGVFSTAACLADGARAAARGAERDRRRRRRRSSCRRPRMAPMPSPPLWVVEGKGRAWLDFQNDVTIKDIKLAAQENFRSVEHMKRYTTQGMATDQGKTSNVGALAVLADATGRTIPETGTTTFRPPYVPVSIAAHGRGGAGQGLRAASGSPPRTRPASRAARR